jgi:hypothetical protein
LCPECGAPVPAGGSCRDNIDALLALEWRLPWGAGALAHFYAMAAYGLQHPDSMHYTAAALAGLRGALGDVLDGKATLAEVRSRIRRTADGATRVTRRAGDAPVPWRRGAWPVTIADVLTVPPGPDAYAECVLRWAQSVCKTLDG